MIDPSYFDAKSAHHATVVVAETIRYLFFKSFAQVLVLRASWQGCPPAS
jgi:hypothetical protein